MFNNSLRCQSRIFVIYCRAEVGCAAIHRGVTGDINNLVLLKDGCAAIHRGVSGGHHDLVPCRGARRSPSKLECSVNCVSKCACVRVILCVKWHAVIV